MSLLRKMPYALVLVLISCLNSCSKSSGYGNNNNNGGNNPPPAPADNIVLRTDSQFGSILTDSNGNTLYFFSPDANGNSACTAGCLALWPVTYYASLKTGTGLDASDFATITRSDGAKQTTYKGWPLYTYAGDAAATDVKGDGIDKIWYVAKPDYSVMLAVGQLLGNDGVKYDSTYHAGTGPTMYMTDDRGVTLYSFKHDSSLNNNFTKADFSNDALFPIAQYSAVQNVPSALNKSLFSTIDVFGKKQLTYNGWPVYRYGADSLIRGNTKGVSVGTPGLWPVMNQFSAAAP